MSQYQTRGNGYQTRQVATDGDSENRNKNIREILYVVYFFIILVLCLIIGILVVVITTNGQKQDDIAQKLNLIQEQQNKDVQEKVDEEQAVKQQDETVQLVVIYSTFAILLGTFIYDFYFHVRY